MKQLKYFAWLYMFLMAISFASCTKQDAYKSFEKGGEIVYPGRADTVQVHSGYKRIQLSVVLGNDPLVTKIKVYWSDRQDSVVQEVPDNSSKDTIKIIIPDLNEGNYNFDIYTYDKNNHQSVLTNVSGLVYGDSYVSSLTNRNLKSFNQTITGSILINWGDAATGELGVELKYKDSKNADKTLIVPADQPVTEIADYKDLGPLTYRSLYKPDSTAFETFSPAAQTVTLPAYERQLDKSKFSLKILPTDVLEGGYGWLVPYLWDEKYSTPGLATQSKIPGWVTFDTGQSSTISRFKMWQANDRLYSLESCKSFEVWGSTDPNPDGSFDSSWTKLATCTSVKPSGLPLGQTTQADINYALAGEEFTIPAGSPKVRYIRIKFLTNWGNGNFMTMEELTFYTHDKL